MGGFGAEPEPAELAQEMIAGDSPVRRNLLVSLSTDLHFAGVDIAGDWNADLDLPEEKAHVPID